MNAGLDENSRSTLLVKSSALSTTLLNLTATPISGVDPLNVSIVDASGTQITSFGGGTQYADGAVRGTATGTIAMGDDGTNIQSIHVDTAGDLQVDVLTMPTVAVTNAGLTELAAAINASSQMDVNIAASGATVPVSGTFWQATQPVSGTVTATTPLAAAAALADATVNPTTTLVGSLLEGFNGTTWDRLKTEDSTNGTLRVSYFNNGAAMASANNADATTQLTGLPSLSFMRGFNGTTWDRVRAVPSSQGTFTTGAMAVSLAITDDTNYRPLRAPNAISDGNALNASISAAPFVFNGTNYDKQRSIINANDTTGTGVTAAGMLAQFDDTTPGTVTENRFGNVRMSVRREVYNQIRDAAGNERGLNIGASGDASVTVVSAIPAGTNNIGDVDIASIAAGTNNIGDVDIVSGTITTVTTLTGGGVAHDGADSGNPNKVGGRAINAEIAAVANNDRTDFVADLTGKQIVLPYANPENFVSGAITTAMTGTTSTSLVAAPAAGLRNYITTIICSNAHATVGTDIVIQDGSGGTTLLTIPAAAVYGGAVVTLPTPLRQPTTATAIFCANVTTGASTKVSAVGWKGA